MATEDRDDRPRPDDLLWCDECQAEAGSCAFHLGFRAGWDCCAAVIAVMEAGL